MDVRRVRYFEKPGSSNTAICIEAVREYLEAGGRPAAVVVASITGETAARMKQSLNELPVPVLGVTGPPSWQVLPDCQFPLISPVKRQELEELGVTVVDCVPSTLSDTVEFSYARYGFRSPTWMIVETLLAVGGYGLKTAVECAVMATDGGFIAPFHEVIAVAGTDRGADTAAVMRSTFASTIFSSDAQKRFVLHEILAMPRSRIFYASVGPGRGEWQMQETNANRPSG